MNRILLLLFASLFSVNSFSQCATNEVQITINITTDNYPSETSWQLIDQNGGGWFISPGALTLSGTTYTYSYCVPDTNCYTFTISDTYGDGICCSWGSGSYSVLADGVTVASGGSFTFSEATSNIGGCLSPPTSCLANEIEIFISITTDNYPSETSWDLVDQNGAGWYILAGDLTQANTTYTWSICVPDTNCYSFTVYDSFGDGLCCSWGSGSYYANYNGVQVASGAAFASSETTSNIGYCSPPVICNTGEVEIVITVNTDNYPTETSWFLMDQFGGGWTNVPLTTSNANQTVTWSICVPDTNCYTFTILDSYGDGLCCLWGSGSYSVTYNGTNVASGASFTFAEENCSIGSCSPQCQITIPPTAISEGESCGTDANNGCDDNWAISNFTITGVTDDWSWGYLTLWGVPIGEWDPDLYMYMTENNSFYYYSDYYLDTWYPNSFSMFANGATSTPLDIKTTPIFTTPWVTGQTFNYTFSVYDDDDAAFSLLGNDDYIGNYTLPTSFTAGTFSITTSGGPDGNAYVDYTVIPPVSNYTPLTNNTIVNGNFWATDNIKDTDWYEFVLNDSSNFSLSSIAEVPYQLMLFDAAAGCDNKLVIDSAFAMQCDSINIQQTLPPGTYWLMVMPSAYSCVSCAAAADYLLDVSWTIVTPPCAIASSFTSNLVSCTNANSGSIDVTVIGGVAPFSYSWSNGATTEDISGLAAGTYTLNITDNFGCPSSVSVTLTTPDNPTISVSSQDVQCNGANDGSIDITVNGGLPSYSYSWSTGATTEDLNNLSSGVYSLTVTDSLGCTSTSSAIINDNTIPITLSFITTDESVPGANDGTVDLTVSGGVSPYVYMWSIGIFTEDLSNLSAGIYYVAVLDSNGCIITDSVIVSTNTTTIDVGIIDIISPTSGCLLDSNESVTVAIKNFLVTPASNFDVVFEFAGNTYTETVTSTLSTYQVLNYTFTPTIDLSNAGVYPLSVYTSSINDIDNSNDSAYVDIHNYDHDFYSADYSMSFEPFEDVSGWYMEDVNMDNVSWNIGPGIGVNYSNGAFYNYNFDGVTPADDWILSQCFVLDANVNYDISFKHRVASIVFPEDMTVMIGSGQTGSGQSDTLISMQNMINTNFDSTGVTFSVPANGIYYIGWHAESNPNMWRIDLDDINLGVSANTAVLGCMDSTASNYNPLATIDDGSCQICLWGCMDTTSLNYDSLATCADSSCIPIIYGCMDSTALNYYSAATVDDNSCIYIMSGCMDTSAINYNPFALIDDSSCVYCIYGCTDTSAANFDSLATCDDGTCIITNYYGCMDSSAINYNPIANVDNGSCTYCIYGCTDSTATNFDSTATCDDGTCTYSTACTNPKPTGLYAYDITDTRAKIHWDNMNSADCMVWKYFVRYREVGTVTWITKSAGVGNGLCNFGLNTQDKLLLNLTSSTTYEFKIKAFYCGGTSSNYSIISNFTTSDLCPDIINLSAQTFNTNHTKVEFSWDTTGVYVFARITLRIDTAGASWQTVGGFGTYFPTFVQNKFGLTPGQSYRAMGRSFCDSLLTSYRSWWTSPIFWTQPGTLIRLQNENNFFSNLEVYPNPSRDIFNIAFELEKKQNIEIRIVNLLGEEVFIEKKDDFIGAFAKQINLSKHPKAVYFLEVVTEQGIVNKKIVLN